MRRFTFDTLSKSSRFIISRIQFHPYETLVTRHTETLYSNLPKGDRFGPIVAPGYDVLKVIADNSRPATTRKGGDNVNKANHRALKVRLARVVR
jgi:hypothetical protein